VGFPLQSLARAPAVADQEFFCEAKKLLGVNHAISLRKIAKVAVCASIYHQPAADAQRLSNAVKPACCEEKIHHKVEEVEKKNGALYRHLSGFVVKISFQFP
jgi:hypothetical protein